MRNQRFDRVVEVGWVEISLLIERGADDVDDSIRVLSVGK